MFPHVDQLDAHLPDRHGERTKRGGSRFLAILIFCALVAAVAVSWLATLIRIVSDAIDDRAADSAAVERFAERVRQARASGESVVSTEGLW